MNVIVAFFSAAKYKQQRERPEFFTPFSLKHAMITFIYSTPHFKYKSLYYHHLTAVITKQGKIN